jgi:hypothetical protein
MNIDRIIVMLKDEGHTYREIADMVDLNVITVFDYYMNATEPKADVDLTPALALIERNGGMGYGRIAAKYATTKTVVKRMLADAA